MNRTPWYALLNQVWNVHFLMTGLTELVKSWADESDTNKDYITSSVDDYIARFNHEHQRDPTFGEYLLWLSDVADEFDSEKEEES